MVALLLIWATSNLTKGKVAQSKDRLPNYDCADSSKDVLVNAKLAQQGFDSGTGPINISAKRFSVPTTIFSATMP
jgi:hypothetical protein